MQQNKIIAVVISVMLIISALVGILTAVKDELK